MAHRTHGHRTQRKPPCLLSTMPTRSRGALPKAKNLHGPELPPYIRCADTPHARPPHRLKAGRSKTTCSSTATTHHYLHQHQSSPPASAPSWTTMGQIWPNRAWQANHHLQTARSTVATKLALPKTTNAGHRQDTGAYVAGTTPPRLRAPSATTSRRAQLLEGPRPDPGAGHRVTSATRHGHQLVSSPSPATATRGRQQTVRALPPPSLGIAALPASPLVATKQGRGYPRTDQTRNIYLRSFILKRHTYFTHKDEFSFTHVCLQFSRSYLYDLINTYFLDGKKESKCESNVVICLVLEDYMLGKGPCARKLH